MYQYSLDFFINLLIRIVHNSPQSSSVQERINILMNEITLKFYQNVSQGLFSKDRLFFSFILNIKINLQNKDLQEKQWEYFLKGDLVLDQKIIQYDAPSYLDQEKWEKILQYINSDPNLLNVIDFFDMYPEYWKEMTECDNPYSMKQPDGVNFTDF